VLPPPAPPGAFFAGVVEGKGVVEVSEDPPSVIVPRCETEGAALEEDEGVRVFVGEEVGEELEVAVSLLVGD